MRHINILFCIIALINVIKSQVVQPEYRPTQEQVFNKQVNLFNNFEANYQEAKIGDVGNKMLKGKIKKEDKN